MTRRCLAVSLTVVALVVFAPVSSAAQADVPRTAWGQPDLQGVWDFRTITPMQRPADLAEKEFLTDEEAAELEQIRAAENAGRDDEVPADIVGNYNTFWIADRSFDNRTALIVDPANGRIPPLTEEAQAARHALDTLCQSPDALEAI